MTKQMDTNGDECGHGGAKNEIHEAVLDLSCKTQNLPKKLQTNKATDAEKDGGYLNLPTKCTATQYQYPYQQSSLTVFDQRVVAAGNANKTLTPSPVEADSTKAINEGIYNNSHVNLPNFVVSSPHAAMVTTLCTPLPDNGVIMRFPVAATAMSYTETPLPLPSSEAMRQASVALPVSPSKLTSANMPTSANAHRKLPRPFKAYPLHKTSLPYSTYSTLDYDSNRNYEMFRASMIEQINKKIHDGPNPKMRRANKNNGAASTCADKTTDGKDSSYLEKRRKNNEAAKRSRDARRAKEDELAIRVAFLEQENALLRHKLEQYIHYRSM